MHLVWDLGARSIGAGLRRSEEGSKVGRRLLDELRDQALPCSGMPPPECLPRGRADRWVRELPKPAAKHHVRKPHVPDKRD